MEKQLNRVKQTKPYKGLSVLHHIPFTCETLLKLEVLIEGGADVTVSSPGFMEADPVLVGDFINSGGVFTQLEELKEIEFDFHLDCAGELLERRSPRIGTVEITGTGTHKYREARVAYPVISVDQSRIKNLEGILGTGEAFVRAFKEITGNKIQDKIFMIFGYGKVGRGMAHYLRNEKAEVIVVELNPEFRTQANIAGFKTIDAWDKEAVEQQASKVFCIATATGKKSVISDYYSAECFKGKYLANMGGEDEFGEAFSLEEVLCQKRPINFFISRPTLLRYLDPVFYAHNMGIDLLQYAHLDNGLHSFPSFLAEEIVEDWVQVFKEDINI